MKKCHATSVCFTSIDNCAFLKKKLSLLQTDLSKKYFIMPKFKLGKSKLKKNKTKKCLKEKKCSFKRPTSLVLGIILCRPLPFIVI